MIEKPESVLLLLVGRSFLGTTRKEEIQQQVGHPIDWPLALEMASREGMGGLLAFELLELSQNTDLDLPYSELSQELRSILIQNGRLLAGLSDLVPMLERRGIPAIVIKGGALLDIAYGGQIALRPMCDLDLLLDEKDLSPVRTALHERGYRTPNPSSSFCSNGFAAMDLHTDLVNASRIRARAFAFRFDPAAIWQKAVPLESRKMLTLAAPHHFLCLAVHALKHGYSKLIWLVDMGLLAQRLDWQETLLEARKTGTMRVMSYALHGLEKLMALPIPPDVKSHLPHLGRIESALLEMLLYRTVDTETLGELMVAFSIPKRKNRISYLLEYLFPRPAVLKEAYPSTPDFLIYPRRMGQVFSHGLSQTGRILLGSTRT